MKIGFVVSADLAKVTGGNLYDLKLVEYLRAGGDQVTVLDSPPRVVDANYDLLIEDALYNPPFIYYNQALKAYRPLPVVGLVHYLRSSDRHGLIGKLADSAYLNTLDGFIFNSADTAREVSALLSRAKPGVIAFPGADRLATEIFPAEIEARAKAKGPLKILFAGNVIRRKGLHVLIDALAKAPRGLWSLTIAGSLTLEPAYVTAVRAKISALGIGGAIVWRGVLNDEALAAAYRDSQALIVPSLYEPAGMVYLEAMGFGLPVIAGTRGGAGEAVTHGREGFLIKPGDSHGLHNYIGIMINNRSILTKMSLQALAKHKTLPTWEKNGRLIREFLTHPQTPSLKKRGGAML